jgi:hypothetical protein
MRFAGNKMRGSNSTRWPILALLLVAFAIPMPLFGQGCAMCYQSAAASGAQGAQALRHGILILLFPPLFISTGIGFFAYGKRNKFNTHDRAGGRESDFEKTSPRDL